MLNDLGLGRNIGVVKFETDKTLSGAGLKVFQHALIPRVVGDHQQEIRMGIEQLAGFVDGQYAPMVG